MRFCILRHETPPGYVRPSHWDLMLERGGVLRTWALAAEPGLAGEAEAIPDHRLTYLTYEGPVPGDRGTVTRWDAGEYETLSESVDELVVRLQGHKLTGMLTLRRREGQRWMVAFSAG